MLAAAQGDAETDGERLAVAVVTRGLADVLASTNSAFRRSTFYEAAGLDCNGVVTVP